MLARTRSASRDRQRVLGLFAAQSALGSCDRGSIAAGDSVLTNTPETAAAFGSEGSVRVGRQSRSRSRRGWVSTRTLARVLYAVHALRGHRHLVSQKVVESRGESVRWLPS